MAGAVYHRPREQPEIDFRQADANVRRSNPIATDEGHPAFGRASDYLKVRGIQPTISASCTCLGFDASTLSLPLSTGDEALQHPTVTMAQLGECWASPIPADSAAPSIAGSTPHRWSGSGNMAPRRTEWVVRS